MESQNILLYGAIEKKNQTFALITLSLMYSLGKSKMVILILNLKELNKLNE